MPIHEYICYVCLNNECISKRKNPLHLMELLQIYKNLPTWIAIKFCQKIGVEKFFQGTLTAGYL